MSVELDRQAKVAAARALYEALGLGDRDALGRLLHPEFVGHAAERLPLDMGGVHVGVDAMCDNLWWRIGHHFKVRAVPEKFQVLEDGRLMVSGTYRGSARQSGNRVDASLIHLIGFAPDGRIASLRQLTNTAAWRSALDGGNRMPTIDYTVENGLATICLDRAEARNAINFQMAWDALEVAKSIAADTTVRAVLIRGNGPALSFGGDIEYFLANSERGFGELFADMTAPYHQALDILSRIEAPIVTAAHGAVAGGGLGYVYAADLVVAAENTRFVTAFARIGVSGDGGGTWHLPRLIGARRAAAAYLRNTPITAHEALAWGIVNEVVDADELLDRATELATELAQGPTTAFAHMRRLLRESWYNDLPAQLAAETQALKQVGDTTDAAMALKAFAAKRAPTFTGR
ncbi:enoyl-CoA hydratase/isomerase family protein [Mycobacterium parascrofulaceum ATCC BAA-614]|uniref:Enoyl-CoA hydratase/isomerase family protein n=1 Tax=Mycobacterium parascrofulaceum ATCC BAA-614 TaxID=525368 RepID=D5P607_9MYCO|nr:enoyl-CoA hydratase-related protein [Mycobacterium parascrofulaceum]EFG78493.1 enoyl-CoA hydratase/isomerase family protein [Mycobacterium parascrofulaceum ATCC BAA-614]